MQVNDSIQTCLKADRVYERFFEISKKNQNYIKREEVRSSDRTIP